MKRLPGSVWAGWEVYRVYELLYLNVTLRINGATGSPVRPIAVRIVIH